MDAIGFMYRNKDTNENIVSFKSSEDDLATGARPKHLAHKEFVISVYKDGEVTTNWGQIFQDLTTKTKK